MAIKLLIAEDDPTIRSNLARILRLEGFDLMVAENGRVALDMARQETPALVISDVMMPELDGHGLLKALRLEPATAQVPFVFLTARADRSDVREGMTLGADDYLTKPFERGELLSLVQTQLARSAVRSAEMQRLRSEASHLRDHDPLTQLPNRSSFEDRLAVTIDALARNQRRGAVVTLELDGIALLRHTEGARAADQALKECADRLSSEALLASADGMRIDLGRIGDSRFALLITRVSREDEVEAKLRRILSTLSAPIHLDGTVAHLSPAAGVAQLPQDATDADTALRHAEAAEPPAIPGGALAFHCAEGQARMSRRARLLQALHGALEGGQLQVLYQPQVTTATGRVAGFEALLRWQHPELGAVSPAEFIPIAEDSGLIQPIGTWVLRTATAQMRQWLDAGWDGRVAVNLSSRQFEDDSLPSLVADALQAAKLPAAALELEITESIAMKNGERVLRLLNALKAQGVAMSMDDFGTGFSSLAYLKHYPLDSLKIDQVFIRNMLSDSADHAICRTVIALAKNFGLEVVAEGVETQAHVDALRALDCDLCQGWHFGKPMPAEAASAFLANPPHRG